MSEFIQVGTAAMRDPEGNFLPAVPLYVRAEDANRIETPMFDGQLMRSLYSKYEEYRKAERAAKRKKKDR